MSASRTLYRHALEITFTASTTYRLLATSSRYWTQVTVIDEKSPGLPPIAGLPLESKHEGAHCVYRGFMEQFEERDGKRVTGLREVAVKWVIGAERMEGIRREAALYENELKPLQGTAVPQFYGFFTGTIRDLEVGCIVLEWCNGPPIENKFELNRQRMVAGIALHKTGVRHNQVIDPTHFIPVSDGTVRMVGFSSATTHTCDGAVPLTKEIDKESRPTMSCTELDALESRFGVDSDRLCLTVRRANRIFPDLDAGFFYIY